MCTTVTGFVRMFLSGIGTGILLFAGPSVLAGEHTFEKTVPADAKGQVQVSTVGGMVEVTGWDQPQIAVQADYDPDEIERVDVINDRGRTVIKVVVPRSHGGDVDLKIRIPSGSELEVNTVSADLRSRGVLGEQRLKAVSGNITAEAARGEVESKTVSGNIVIRGDKEVPSARLSSVSGDIRYERGGGDLEATTVSGDLYAVMQGAKDIRVRTTSGDITLTGKLADTASVEGETISGELIVRMAAPPAGFRYEVSSFSGDIENCFGEEAVRVSKYGPGSRLSGSRGEGRGEMRLKTLSGDVQLCDR